ncbi:unnamed protein product [Musa acuminata subsp. malaccensis]|uniref:Ninja-family protein n=1 Tax=Musa acuminata subsp. malaccensis TaxID=214687 RepID=A0A804IYW9_MUSAM|nr:PREDICTED: ninja-family protein AFP3-like [Musa acuminata subsp. malaccensis]CAG1844742.1 unnamed protein product [Musa acuminata subsp. malaccensis]
MEEEEEVSSPVQCCPRDFLRRFGSGGGEELTEAKRGEPSEVEHSLGLSLGGCSGNEPNDRCTASVFPLRKALPEAEAAAAVPADAEEQRKRKRKELQSQKRTRSEKRDRKGDILDEEMEDGPRPSAAANGVVPPALATKPRAGMVDGSKCFRPETQASIGSQGSGCSGVSEFNCGAKQGIEESKPTKAVNATAMNAGRVMGDTKEVERDMMPCVSATGDGPNGTRIEGFLYKYRKGEDVRIVCVCHGRFFTPAEFVKHAGGGDVAHPLRHIVVNPFPSAFL